MSEVVEFDNKEDFDQWHASVNFILGYPNASTKTERYTHVYDTLDGAKNGKLYAQIDEKVPKSLLFDKKKINFDRVKRVEKDHIEPDEETKISEMDGRE